MRFYFVRHGQTDYNIKNAYYGQSDISLNDCGRVQAASVAGLLEECRFDEIWESDMKRVTETVDIILTYRGVCEGSREDTVADHSARSQACRMPHRLYFPEFREIDFGKWEGLDYKEVQARFPEDFKRWSDDWKRTAPTGGECFSQFFCRVKTCFEQLTAQCGDGDGHILVAAHNGTMRILFAVMMGLSMDGTWHFNFEQDAYSVVDYEYNNFTVRKINSREKATGFGRF